ncbi:MAG: protein kinase domain-containing protein [Candidatus Sericytochromatia bacterium]
MLTQGAMLVERYVVIEMHGQGGTATVYRAMDVQENRMVALKHLLLPGNLHAEERDLRIRRFQNEATILGLLDHPHVLRFYELVEDGDEYYMILEFLEATSLDALAPALRHQPGQLLQLLDQLAEALEYLHARGVIHLDIKPENVMVINRSEIKLLDFGIARVEGMETPTSGNALVGTVGFMSPEQLKNSRLTQAQSDIYSLGVLMYHCFTGRLPYEADNPGMAMLMIMNQEPLPPVQLNPLIGEDLNQLILTCMHKQPQHRFSSCRQLRQLMRVLMQRVFASHLPPNTAAQAILPRIRMFKEFSFFQAVQTLVEKQGSGQCLIWTAFDEGSVWLQNGNILMADIKNKRLDLMQAFFDITCWESGNFIYIPNAALPQGPTIRQNAYDVLQQGYEYNRRYQILWEHYQENDLPEIIVMPGSGDQLSEAGWMMLELIDGNHCIGQLQNFLPYARLEILETLQNLEDRQFIFVERTR